MASVALQILIVLFVTLCVMQRVLEVAFAYNNSKKGHVIARWSIVILSFAFFLYMLGSLLEFFLISKHRFDWRVMCLGILIYGLSIILRIASILALKEFRSYNVEVRVRQTIVSNGPYSFIRHPIYLAMIIEAVSVPLALQAWFALCISLFIYIPIVITRLLVEEKSLLRVLGNEYTRYKQTTPALIPAFWGGAK